MLKKSQFKISTIKTILLSFLIYGSVFFNPLVALATVPIADYIDLTPYWAGRDGALTIESDGLLFTPTNTGGTDLQRWYLLSTSTVTAYDTVVFEYSTPPSADFTGCNASNPVFDFAPGFQFVRLGTAPYSYFPDQVASTTVDFSTTNQTPLYLQVSSFNCPTTAWVKIHQIYINDVPVWELPTPETIVYYPLPIYNLIMPIETIVCESATCTVNYASTTPFTVESFAIYLFIFISAFLGGYLIFKAYV